jgi:hypothetical protein
MKEPQSWSTFVFVVFDLEEKKCLYFQNSTVFNVPGSSAFVVVETTPYIYTKRKKK